MPVKRLTTDDAEWASYNEILNIIKKQKNQVIFLDAVATATKINTLAELHIGSDITMENKRLWSLIYKLRYEESKVRVTNEDPLTLEWLDHENESR